VSEQGPEDERLAPASPERVKSAYRPRRRTQAERSAEQQAPEAKLLELAAALEQVRRSEQDLADTFENATVGLQWVGPDGLIVRVNQAQLDLLGCPRDEVVGRHFADFHADPEIAEAIWRRLGEGETLSDHEARLRCRDGSLRHVLIDSSVRWEDGRFVHSRCFIRDRSERRRAEQRLVAQYRVADTLAHSETIAGAAVAILRTVCQQLDWAIGAMWRMDAASGELQCAEVWHQPSTPAPAFEAATRGRTFTRGTGLPGDVWQSGQAVWIADVNTSTNFPRAAVAAAEGLHTGFAFPIVLDGQVLGVMEFFSPEIRSRDDALLELTTAIGSQIGQFIERRNAEDALRASELRLKEADRRKDEFLAMLAHELRNPLAPIANAAEFFRSGVLDPELQWCADVIDRQVLQLTRLIDDLLDVSRITQGRLALRRERVALVPIVQGVVEASRPLMQKWGHDLAVEVAQVPVVVDADPTRLAQIMLNLIHNAAKYTPPGGRVGLSVGQDADGLVIRVTDTGIGIPPGMLSHVFEMFTQLDHSLGRSEGGLGIGLTLVQRLVELHGGTVEAHSDGPGTGSEFVVRLPVILGPADFAEPGTATAALPTGRRILVVDDNRDAADTLAALLRMRGNAVETAHDGLSAIAVAMAFRPGVVLLDLGLPKLNGYEVARRIRALAGGQAMLLIAVTGWGQEEARRRSREAGFDHHLTKPVELPVLTRLLAEGV
jgi:PAS domain S-box-containing protein